MCEIAKKKNFNKEHNIKFECFDFLEFELKNPISIFISYYTMQFVHSSTRQQFIDKIFNSLEWGGALFLFEKIRSPDARFQDIYNDLQNQTSVDILTTRRSQRRSSFFVSRSEGGCIQLNINA